MASTIIRGNTIYITWYNPMTGQTARKSTGLKNTKTNQQKAKLMATEFQAKINQAREHYLTLGIKKHTLANAIEQFLKINSNKDKNTVNEYNWFLRRFTEKFNPGTICTDLTKQKCEEWLIDLRSATFTRNGKQVLYSKNALHAYTKVLKKFLNFLFEYNYIPPFKLNKDVVHRPEVKPIVIFSPDDLKILVDGLENKGSNFKVTFYLLLYTGLRPSDIYNLEVKDIDLEQKNFQYYSEKTDEYFRVPIHQDLIPILQERIKEIGSGRLLNYENISNIGRAFRRYLEQINLLNKGYNLRTFRKTFITLMHQGGADLATVARLVGHKKITTTEKYYNKLSLAKQNDELSKLKFNINRK